MSASRRKWKLAFQKRTVTANDYNEEVEVWKTVFHEYGAIYYGSGNEQRIAAQTQGDQAASFEVPRNSCTSAITVADFRILYGGGVWDIRSFTDVDFNKDVRINAVRAVA
ncbi:head-tail adaptor protein [Sphingobium sp. 3R8]|uniref:phage head completion protein n=1 Tax=Sphingobium sp. 3R8 TaxID=2874921 RepID=UPI001CCC0D05|nr:head-tail adaptor protein [Sphingobium sp. 3R8]MBZ9650002.1 head-tail adaptor protein [Sphingobium sp. 3R8]